MKVFRGIHKSKTQAGYGPKIKMELAQKEFQIIFDKKFLFEINWEKE